MAEQKRSSRLRLPTWLQPRPQPTDRHPPAQTSPQAPPSPPAQTPPESQPSPPSTERTKSRRSRVTPKPASPPSRAPIQPKAETQQPPQASQPSTQTSSQPPPSPSLTATKAQSTPGEAITQPPLPSENLQPTTRLLPFPPSTEPISSVSEKETKPARSEPESQELQQKAETASENVQANKMPAEHLEASVPVTEPPKTSTTAENLPVLTQKSGSSIVSSETKSLPESDRHPGQHIEGKEILQKDGSKEKIAGVTEILSAAPGSEAATQMHPSVAFDAEPKQLEKEEVTGKKETTSNSSSHGKEDQTVILNLKDKVTVSESCHEPNISNRGKAPLQKEIKDNISKFLHGMATHQQKLSLGESQATVVTLAGENRGASMQLLGSELAKREGTVHIRRGYKINPDESGTDGEMISEGRGSQDSKTGEDQEPKACINSNVQGVNNSIMFNSSINERDPGVQLALTHDLTETIKPNRMQSPETHKAEVIVTTAQKLTYEPIVRRRCLRGLFLEPSDSDADNPEKPRRHGCQYACKGKSKDNEIDVL